MHLNDPFAAVIRILMPGSVRIQHARPGDGGAFDKETPGDVRTSMCPARSSVSRENRQRGHLEAGDESGFPDSFLS